MRRGHRLEEVAAYVRAMCVPGSGRVVTVAGSSKVVVCDMPSWTDEASECIRCRFPCASVSIFESASSLSGFVVVIDTAKGGTGASGQSVVLFILLGACALAGILSLVGAVPALPTQAGAREWLLDWWAKRLFRTWAG